MSAAIFPARGGSVRIPRKNIRDFMGKPMLAWPVAAARESGLFDRVIVSTDCLEVMRVAWDLGCEVIERERDDGAKGTQEVAGDVIRGMRLQGQMCVIYPCSPLLTASELKDSREALDLPGTNYVMSVLDPLADAGCFYWGQADAFASGAPLLGPLTRMYPIQGIDINTEDDWARAEQLWRDRG
jgi:pseudaminic acid cytidylyltransferase